MAFIAGVDGCKFGWLCITEEVDTGKIDSKVYRTAQDLFTQTPEPILYAIDIPIGLNETGPRLCDIQARELLGNRRSSVFPAPIRPALHANNRAEADAIRRKIESRGVSSQSFGIYHKVAEVDEFLTSSSNTAIKEVHPELCFWAWNNQKAMSSSKKKIKGLFERHRLVAEYFGEEAIEMARERHLVKDVAHDDIYDAFAALWTAKRIHKKIARRIPEPVIVDKKGLSMEMWY